MESRALPAIGPHALTIRSWLTKDREAPAKQRHTARRIWERLVDEHGAEVAESSVRRYVRECRRELQLDRLCTFRGDLCAPFVLTHNQSSRAHD